MTSDVTSGRSNVSCRPNVPCRPNVSCRPNVWFYAVRCVLAAKENRISLFVLLACITCNEFLFNGFTAVAWGQDINFRQQIQPILAKKCYACHGPDSTHREAELRLDQEDSAKGQAITAGDADNSELMVRILSTDVQSVMPPPESGHSLTPTEIETLRKWINQGAPWQQHWAFDPISKQELPKVVQFADGAGAKNEIDRFIYRSIQAAGLQPSPTAEKHTLIRRAYLDLIGLPPTFEQVQAFVNDTRPVAFEKVIDELLASPQYGEQMAVSWLDAARFADTNGYQNDFYRSMWPWRDWVINAFNQNLSYDQFIIQQIAGDLLPAPSNDQMIATGFNRNNRSVTEGGSIEEEWQVENCIDRVETTAASFLGLTLGCARCHDHKYDPISQKEFYQFYAFFNNVDEKGVYNERRGNTEPLLSVPTATQIAALEQLQSRIAGLKAKITPAATSTTELLNQWRSQNSTAGQDSLPSPIFVAKLTPEVKTLGMSPAGPSLQLTGQPDSVALPSPPDFLFKNDQAFSWSAWITGDSRGAIFGQMDESDAYRGVDGIILGDGRVKIHLISQWRTDAIAVISKVSLPKDQWTFITATYDGAGKASGYKLYFNGKKVNVEVDIDALNGPISPKVLFKIGQRSQSELFSGQLADFRLYDQLLSDDHIVRSMKHAVVANYDSNLPQPSQDYSAAQEVATQFINSLEHQSITQKIGELQVEIDKQKSQQQTTMIMRDRPEYRETYLLRRGQYDQPETSEPLWPAIPKALPQLTAQQPNNRLGLARWMVDERNPLVARIAVNRAWYKFFKRGLVESVDNFGRQGAPPTHPELLDWLADDFRKSGWDLKRLHKQIMSSATYQQSSNLTEEFAALDPANQWLARGPRHRLGGEQIRDLALSISGLLQNKMGGPSVRPYQPDGLWEELAGGANDGPYKHEVGPDLYRRSLYTYRKRTVSHPTVASFDAPSWEICQVKRSITNTPLQSLALLNDVTYVEAARNLAQQMLHQAAQNKPNAAQVAQENSVAQAIEFGFQSTVLRKPTIIELDTLTNGYQQYLTYYQANPDQAEALTKIGESKSDTSLSTTQLAAMTSVASILLNLDEVITKE